MSPPYHRQNGHIPEVAGLGIRAHLVEEGLTWDRIRDAGLMQ